MKVDWSPLRRTLKQFRNEGLALPLWWRDDDATEPTTALDRLYETALRMQVPVHVAVIPGFAKPGLASLNDTSGMFVPVAHGWKHVNNAPLDEKRSEFGTARPGAEKEIKLSFDAMRSLFDTDFLPLFVPPWNRFDRSHIQALRPAGYRGISMFPSKRKLGSTPGLHQIKTHIDPVDWHGSYGLHTPEKIIARTVYRLQARRAGLEDVSEPLGLLTHHLVHTEEIWQFSENLLTELLNGGAYVQPIRPILETDP